MPLVVLAGLMVATSAQAAGVTAGTVIQNTASATYTSGTDTTTVSSNTANLRVDELLDVAVATLDATAKSLGTGTTVLTYSVTNTGNGAEAFRINVDPAISGNGFDAEVQTIAIDTNGNNVFDAGIDVVIANGGTTAEIAADGSLKIFVVVALPSGTANDATSQVRLTALAATGTGSPGNTFAGQGTGGGDAVVGSTTAQDDALGALIASSGTGTGAVALIKSFTIVDQFGGTQPIPGATITYTIRADVTGTGPITALRVTDVIPAGTTYVAGTLTLDGTAQTDATDSDAGTASAAGIAVDIGTQSGGTSRLVAFKTRIH
jgi:uncharacterized repeat protein (TIGR01451 family)